MSEQRPQKRRKLTHNEETDAGVVSMPMVSDLLGSMFPQHKTNKDVDAIIFNYLDVKQLLSCASVCKYWSTHVFALLERINFIGLLYPQLWQPIYKGLKYDQLRHARISADFEDEIVMHWDLLSKCTNLVSLKTPNNSTQPELQPATIAKMTQLTQLLYVEESQDNLYYYTVLRNLTKLETLFFVMYFRTENLSEVPEMWSMLTRLTKLTYLNLEIRNEADEEAEIQVMPFNLAPLRQMTQLTELHFRHLGDNLDYHDIDSFAVLTNLKTIGITDDRKSQLKSAFSSLAPSLTSLSGLMTYFNITEVVPLELLQRLTYLDCAERNSELTLTNLMSLSIAFCRNYDFAYHWPNLTELHLSLISDQSESILKLTALRNLKYLEIGRQSEGPYLTQLLSLMQHVPLIVLHSYRKDWDLPFKNVMIK